MLNGPATTGGRVQREKKAYGGTKPEGAPGKSAASAKFDALFGGSGPAEDPAIIAATTVDEGQS